jgi:hypothetical protein
MNRYLDTVSLWDDRVCVLQVTGATRSAMRLRALVSAEDAPRLWDLRCLVREHLVAWVRDHQPTALQRLRTNADVASVAAASATSPDAATPDVAATVEVQDSQPGGPRVFSTRTDDEHRGQET